MNPSAMPRRITVVKPPEPKVRESAADREFAKKMIAWDQRDGIIPKGITADSSYRAALRKAGVR